MLNIDGSYGEGGGQILRTTLSLSAVLGQPVTIENIRAGRSKPGLRPQHLTCVRAVAEITSAHVEGDEVGSQRVTLRPEPVTGGQHVFDVGSGAGSAMLILQAALPPLCFAPEPSHVTIRGGTHNPWAPPFDYVDRVFLPTVSRLGVQAKATLKKAGWYPKGGGEVIVQVSPAGELTAVDWSDRGPLERLEFLCLSSNLPGHIGKRQCKAAQERLAAAGSSVETTTQDLASIGAGTMSLAVATCENAIGGFSALGERGKPAEKVAREACDDLLSFLHSHSTLDPHLADQVVLYAALASGETRFTTQNVTQHLLTNLWAIEQFLGKCFDVTGKEGEPGTVLVRGAGRL